MPGSIYANTAMSWTEPSSWAPASSPRHWCSLPKPSAGCWLNRDQAEVDKYLADERCTFTFTLNAYYSMFSGILRLHDPAFLAKMPKDLPLLFLAGDADPVGEQGKGVQRAIQSLKDAGVQNIECKLYPGARHELLVETNHQEVFEDIGSWLEKHLA